MLYEGLWGVDEPKFSVNTFVGQSYELGTANGYGPLARFQQPAGIAADDQGALYVADSGNTMIRKISRTGEVTTLAGAKVTFQDVLDDVGHGYRDGTGRLAKFSNTTGIAVDNDGNVYVGDMGNRVIRKITPSGVVTTLAGTPGKQGLAPPHLSNLNCPYREGPLNAATFGHIEGLAVDTNGNVFVADEINSVIRKVTPTGVTSTFVGKPGEPGYQLGTGQNARIGSPRGIAIGPDGNLFVADNANSCVWKITPGGTVSKLAGGGSIEPLTMGRAGYVDATGDEARFGVMWGIAVRPDGNVLVTDSYSKTVRMIKPSGAVTTVGGGQGQSFPGDTYGPNSGFADPVWLTVDRFSNLYVSEKGTHRIRKGVVPKPGISPSFAVAPQNEMIHLGGLAVFPYLVKGSAPYSIEVRKNGVPRNPGSPISTEGLVMYYWISPFNENDAGDYQIKITNDFGSVTSPIITLSVDPISLLKNPLDNDQLTWADRGDWRWSGQTIVTHDGVDAARSGKIGDNQESSFETTVAGDGTISFWWSTSASAYDELIFFINDEEQTGTISGTTNWNLRTFVLLPGAHTFRWTYRKDSSGSSGAEAGWVDQVVWTPASTAIPQYLGQSSASAVVGQNFFFPMSFSGTPSQFQATGLPHGLTINLNSGVISGVPTQTGSSNIQVIASNSAGLGTAILNVTVSLSGADAVAPQSLPVGAWIDYTGNYMDSNNGQVSDSGRLKVTSSTTFESGTYNYTKTSISTATLTYTTNYTDVGFTEYETGTLLLTFTSQTGGTYSSTGSYSGTEEDEPFSGNFSGSGTFTHTDGDLPSLALGTALDSPDMTWAGSGEELWMGQTAVSHDGGGSARSGAVAHAETSSLRTTVTGPRTLTFWWKVSSQESFDTLDFRANSSSSSRRISGEVDWCQEFIELGPSTQVLEWIYTKDGSVSVGQDAGWVDQVTWTPSGPVAAFVTWQSGFFNSTQLANPAISGELADYDKDGIPNLLEYLLGGNPTLSNSGLLPTITKAPGSTNLVFTYNRKLAATGVTQVIEYSPNLAPPWTPAAHGTGGVTIVTTPVPGDATAEQITVTISSTQARRFVRLKVSR